MTTWCCNDTNANHCNLHKQIFFYAMAMLTCSNDFWQKVAEFVLLANGGCHLES